MKTVHHHLIEAIKILNPAAAPAKGKIEQLCLRQENGDSLFVNEVIVEAELGMIYAKSTADDPIWHMVPVNQLVGLEVGLHNDAGIKAWFKDARTLPAIIGKLVGERKKAP